MLLDDIRNTVCLLLSAPNDYVIVIVIIVILDVCVTWLILKAYLACCNEGRKKSVENILILQNKAEAETSHFLSQHKLR